WLTTVHRLAGAAGAITFSALFVWQFREAIRLPDLKSQVPFACAGAAIVLYALASTGSRNRAPHRLLIQATAAGLMCLLIIGLSYELSPSLRWELIRRHTLFGFPAWSVLGPSVVQTEDALWVDRTGPGYQPHPHTVDWDRSLRRPTIVFILIDTLRQDSLGAYGGDRDLMPRLNAIARESVVFEDVLANASWTRPSVGSMFTGLYQEYHGAVGREDSLNPPTETLAEILSGKGYETAAFVTNWGAVGRDAGFDQGFGTFRECRAPDTPYLRADALTRNVMQWVKRRSQDPTRSQTPLFLYVHYLDPHFPYLSGGHDSYVFSKTRRAYENEVAFVDEHAGQLIHSLERTLDDPLFTLVASDHGEEFGEHGRKGHGYTAYQEVVRVPAFIRTPDHAGASVSARLEGRDLFDLVLQAAADPSLDPSGWGRSKDKPLRYTSEYLQTNLPRYRPEYRHVCIRAVDREGLFFIQSALGPTLEIYDRREDPRETRNMIRHHRALVPGLESDLEGCVPAPWVRRKSVQLSGDSMEQLKALGYIK
ncbi:MAG: sulfatase, partial [Acidobacteriota bacterium]